MKQFCYVTHIRALCIIGVLIWLCVLTMPVPSFALIAGTGNALTTTQIQKSVYTFGISTTLLNGEGQEYVYAPELDGMKVSDLRWESENVFLVGGHLTMQYSTWLTLNAAFWKSMSAQTGTMTDDDWNAVEGLFENDEPRFQTNFSESKSDLTEGGLYDIHGRLRLMQVGQGNMHLRGIVGYKKALWEWEASDGYWIYIEELVETYDEGIVGIGTAGNIDGVGIRYQQEITIPYIGISLDYQGRTSGMQAYALYSNRVEMEATDDHLARDLRTVDSFSDGKYWAVGLSHRWDVSPKMSVAASVEYEEIQTLKGDSIWTFYEEGVEEEVKDGAGAGYHDTAVSFSVFYAF